MRTFSEYFKIRINEDMTSPGMDKPLDPKIQQAAAGVVAKMGAALIPPDPKMSMQDFLKKNPNKVAEFTKSFMKNPLAGQAGLTGDPSKGGADVDTAMKLMMGNQDKKKMQ